MDIKDVSIKDLFADIKTSFRKLEQQKQKLNKEERRRKLLKKKRQNQGGCNREEGVLFPSMVNPNWNADNTNTAAADEMPSSSELPSKQQINSDKSSEQPPTTASSLVPPPTTSNIFTTATKPKKTMAQSILDLLAAHNSTSSITTTSYNTTTHSLPTKNNISEAELKRRRDIEISIRNKSKQIIQENERLLKLKPLVFSKPTFRYSSQEDKSTTSINQGQEGREGGSTSSLSSLGKKRKASSITNTTISLSPLRCYTGTSTNPTSISNNNCFQLQTLGSSYRNHSGIYAASSSALPPPSKPYTNPYEDIANCNSGVEGSSGGIMGGYFVPYGSNRQYTQEEVRGLVDFAHEWITPDSMKRRRI